MTSISAMNAMNERGLLLSSIIVVAMMQIGCADRQGATGKDAVRPEERAPVIVLHPRSTFPLSDSEVASCMRLALDRGDLAEAQQGLDAEIRLQPGETFAVRVSAQGMDDALVFVRPTNRRCNGSNLQFLVSMDGTGRVLGSIRAVGIPQQ